MQIHKFNPAIFDKFEEYNITDTDSAILYLLSVYYDIRSNCLPDEVVKQVNISKIIERNFADLNGGITWNIPLFLEGTSEEKNEKWAWVEEYRKKFQSLKPEARGDRKGTLTKMQKFFAENPDVRVDEVMKAADLYLQPFKTGGQAVTYIQQADYFISKINKGDKSSRLTTYVEMVREKAAKETINLNQGNRFNQQVRS